VEGVDFDGGLGGGGKGSLSTLAGGSETADGSLVVADVLLELALELFHEVVHETVIEILTTQVSVSTSGLYLEDTTLDGKEGHIECATTQVEDEDVLLSLSGFVQTVGNSSGCGLVDDTEDVQTRDGTGILGGLTLAVIEIGGDSDHSLGDVGSEEGLSSLLHLDQHHRTDLFGGEILALALELDSDVGLVTLLGDDFEWPVLHIILADGVGEASTNEPLCIEHSVLRVEGNLVLCSIADQTLLVGEGNI